MGLSVSESNLFLTSVYYNGGTIGDYTASGTVRELLPGLGGGVGWTNGPCGVWIGYFCRKLYGNTIGEYTTYGST